MFVCVRVLTCVFVYLFARSFVCLSVCVCLFIRLPVCLFVCVVVFSCWARDVGCWETGSFFACLAPEFLSGGTFPTEALCIVARKFL